MKTITIKAIDLLSIAYGAEMAFEKLSRNGNKIEKELKAATKLKKELNRIMWDEDTELVIMEVPF